MAVLVFLVASDFFAAWHGRLVSVAPTGERELDVRLVRIAEGARTVERWWPASIVEPYALPVDANPAPPVQVPDQRPSIDKSRFTLQATVRHADRTDVVATTRPQNLGLALLAWLLTIAVRNMAVGGAPWALQRPPRAEGAEPGEATVTATHAPPKTRPRDSLRPPSRPRRGVGR